MDAQSFMKQHELTYSEYQNVRDRYSHVGSFAYWKENYTTVKYIAKDLLADTEAEFNDKLKGNLQNGVVFLGLNFGARKNDKHYADIMNPDAFTVDERLKMRQELNNMSNQYVGNSAHKSVYKAFNPYDGVGDPRIFWGGYMTDLFKFPLDEEGTWQASGIVTPHEDKLGQILKETPQLIPENIEGLRYELHQVVGVPEKFFLVLMGNEVQKYEADLQAAFPEASIVHIKHYSSPTSAEEYQREGQELTEQALKTISEW